MTHTTLFKNEIYLIVTSIISIGVLSGYEYLSIVLAALLIIPVIKLPDRRTFNKEKLHSNCLDKCAPCTLKGSKPNAAYLTANELI